MSDGEVTDRELERQLGEELLQIHRESYGRGAGRAEVTISQDVVYCLLDELELLPNEEFLVDSGRGDAVIQLRSDYQQTIASSFRAAVERTTGRRVVSFASITKLSPHYAVEIFRLA